MIKLYNGDCLNVMRDKIEDNFIDTIITDPPYGLSFMGKKWDYDIPSIDIFKEMLRILKPGGTLLCFAGSRTQHRMAVNIEDSGFILKDCILWIYGSGFPKATDISKQIDKISKRIGLFQPFAKHYEKQRRIKNLTHNQICEMGEFYNNHNHGGASSNWGLGLNVPTLKQWKILKPLLNLSDKYLPLIERIEAEREIILKRELKDIPGIPACGNKRLKKQANVTAPATDQAKLWNGWKSHGLKPAYEPIILAVKQNDGSYANNALKHGVSGLNIDGGRIETTELTPRNNNNTPTILKKGFENKPKVINPNSKGRYPSNIILDESINTEWSRFFYTAKASTGERSEGCEDIEESKTNDGRNKDADIAYQRGKTLRTNSHPTVKPESLMIYLCELTKTPTGGVVLDPFMGSGTTGIGCKATNREFIGIEKEPEYFKIAEARLKKPVMRKLF